MKTNLNFNSAICTSREQSKRLLALGLKRETADMHYYHTVDFEGNEVWYPSVIPYENVVITSDFVGETEICLENHTIPAWSLHRLIEMADTYIEFSPFTGVTFQDGPFSANRDNDYDAIVDIIEWLIQKNHFNKEYLEE